jgi:hypothetical protein
MCQHTFDWRPMVDQAIDRIHIVVDFWEIQSSSLLNFQTFIP